MSEFRTNGAYAHEPLWFRGFRYDEERARGFPHAEDLASPGTFCFDLAAGAPDYLQGHNFVVDGGYVGF